MYQCHYCGYYNDKHNEKCPEIIESKILWEKGYRDGRSGADSKNNNPSYRLGYTRGINALEEYENGYDPRFN